MPFEFLFHGQRVVVEDLQASYVVENDKLLTMIEHNAPERTLVKQEGVVRRLRDLLDDQRPARHRTAGARGS